MFDPLFQFIRDHFCTQEPIPLHAPVFNGLEREYLLDAVDSTFVSSVGAYVVQFEWEMAQYTGSPDAIVTVNGTSALHMALILAGVGRDEYVITQALSFVATANAIAYCHAEPIFVDVDRQTLGMSAHALSAWLEEHAFIDDDGLCRHRGNLRIIRACVPMHTFGHPADLDGLMTICQHWGLKLIEDAAESLGSLYKGRHTGTFGDLGILSFNGNKIMTTGAGGMILTDHVYAHRAKHLTTTAKKPHPFEYIHDELGFNYRMPNLNAAMGCAQLAQLDSFIENKRALAMSYRDCLSSSSLQFVNEPPDCRSNYWLNAVICEDISQRNALLHTSHEHGIMTRPIWEPLNRLPMFNHVPSDPLNNTQWLADRVVNLPSSVVPGLVKA